ncbi:MAG: hypothetical protein F6K35_29480 [Okeania sp. SIO2H7]|nr:hypothetical protein [Okeania sp. SIO2H7]
MLLEFKLIFSNRSINFYFGEVYFTPKEKFLSAIVLQGLLANPINQITCLGAPKLTEDIKENLAIFGIAAMRVVQTIIHKLLNVCNDMDRYLYPENWNDDDNDDDNDDIIDVHDGYPNFDDDDDDDKPWEM